MGYNIQSIKMNREEIKDLWYALILLPVFAFIWYLFIKAFISGMEVIFDVIKKLVKAYKIAHNKV